MGLAVDPAFATNRYIYTCFASTLGGANGDVRLVRWTVDANFTDPDQPDRHRDRRPAERGRRARAATPAAARASTRRAASGSARATPRRARFPRTRARSAARCSGSTATARASPATRAARSTRAICSYGHRNVQGIAFRPSDGLGVSDRARPRPRRRAERARDRATSAGTRPDRRHRLQRGRADDRPRRSSRTPCGRSGARAPAPSRPSGADVRHRLAVGRVERRAGHRLAQGPEAVALELRPAGRFVDVGVAITDRGRLRSPVQGPDGNLYITTDNGGDADVILKVAPG